MNIRFEYDPQANLSHFTVEGGLDIDQISTKINEVMELVDRKRLYFDLWDVRAVELTENTSEMIWAMAEVTRQRATTNKRPSGKTALVADSAHLFGLGRMYEQMLRENVHWEHQVFDDINEAMAWLLR